MHIFDWSQLTNREIFALGFSFGCLFNMAAIGICHWLFRP